MTALKRTAAILFVAALIVPATSSVATAATPPKAPSLSSLTSLLQGLTKGSATTTNPLAGLNLSNLNLGSLKGLDLSKLGLPKGIDLSKLKGIDVSKLTKGLDLSKFGLPKNLDLSKILGGLSSGSTASLGGIDLSKILALLGSSGIKLN